MINVLPIVRVEPNKGPDLLIIDCSADKDLARLHRIFPADIVQCLAVPEKSLGTAADQVQRHLFGFFRKLGPENAWYRHYELLVNFYDPFDTLDVLRGESRDEGNVVFKN